MTADEGGTAGEVGVEALDAAVVEGEDVVLAGLQHEQLLEAVQPLRLPGGEVVRLRPVVGCVELPDVVVERRQLGAELPRSGVPGDGGPALVVGAPVAEHLEVLRRVPLLGLRVVEGVGHAHALQRATCLVHW